MKFSRIAITAAALLVTSAAYAQTAKKTSRINGDEVARLAEQVTRDKAKECFDQALREDDEIQIGNTSCDRPDKLQGMGIELARTCVYAIEPPDNPVTKKPPYAVSFWSGLQAYEGVKDGKALVTRKTGHSVGDIKKPEQSARFSAKVEAALDKAAKEVEAACDMLTVITPASPNAPPGKRLGMLAR